jgi:hypothetical protein
VNRPGQKPVVLMDAELKAKLKSFLMELVTSPASALPFNIFEQSLEVVRVFVKLDFPDNWPELVEHIFNSLDSIAANIESISADNVEDLYRFLKFYLEVLKEQSAKKLGTKRASFVKQSKVHLEKLYPLWENIDLKNWNEDSTENFGENDRIIFVISNLLDK